MKITDEKTLTAAKEQLARYKISLETHDPKYWKARGFGPKTIDAIRRGLLLDYNELKDIIGVYEQTNR